MKIARVELTRIRLRLRTPIATARGPIDIREGVLLALTSESTLVGHGEALPLAGFSAESADRTSETLSRLARVLIGRQVTLRGRWADDFEDSLVMVMLFKYLIGASIDRRISHCLPRLRMGAFSRCFHKMTAISAISRTMALR